MEAFLRRVRRRLGEGDALVHVVLGGPEPDVDTVAATLCLALHLCQKEPSSEVCVPVLSRRPCDAALPQETVRYLRRLEICEDSLLWREDVDLIKLHRAKRLSLTLLREGLLPSSECHSLEPSIQRVVHHGGQQDAADDGSSSAVTTVTRELLQEAAEHIRAALWETLGEALRLQSEAFRSKHGHRSAQLEELQNSLEQWNGVTVGQQGDAEPQDLEQLLSVELKEFSDGETTVALTSVTTDVEDWYDDVKSFSEQHDYDGLVVLLSITAKHPPDQQVAVFSYHTDLLNQICCELEESSSWCLSGALEARDSLQVYHIPLNTPLSFGSPPPLVEDIEELLKGFVNRRSSVLSCHPSSRTSSTEGVAGSVEFSQGSSGINDMDGSDMERLEGGTADMAALPNRATAEDDTGGEVGAVVELVSPDSGMTTIRSSRSSKASSVFLSDESPVGDITAGGVTPGVLVRNQSPVVFSCLSPPVPPERKKHRHSRNKSENLDLLSFDPLRGNDNSAGKEMTSCKSRGAKREESSSFSELEELNLVDFSGSSAVEGLQRRISSVDQHDQIQRNDTMDTVVPPTPVNSVVGSRPPSSCGVRFFPEDVVERINSLQHKDSMSSSLSETWDELDTQGASTSSDSTAWNLTMDTESPINIMEEVSGRELTEKRNEDESLHSRGRFQTLEPQLSLVIEPTESYDTWNPDSIAKDQWNPVSLSYLQLTPPEEDETGKSRLGVIGVKEKTSSLSRKKAVFNTLTPDTSKEEDEGTQGKKGDRQMELLDFWTYTAQKGFLKSDSGTTTSYPDSLDMWNMTIRDDSLSPLTTPDNASETYGSFCTLSPTAGAEATVDSPQGFTDSGMAMWNTTIQEDSSSSLTTPEASENGNVNYMAALEGIVSPEPRENKEKVTEKDIDTHKGLQQTLHKVEPDYNVKIIIESVEDGTLDEDKHPHIQSQKDDLQELRSADMSIPVPGMVTSTSEYDNVGSSNWSLASSPEAYVSPVIDLIQLEQQTSPFVAVTKPNQINEEHYQSQQEDYLGKTAYTAGQQQESQVFQFGGTSESGHLSRGSSVESKYDNKSGERSEEDADWSEQTSNHSPFLLVDIPVISHDTSADHQSSPGMMDLTGITTILAAGSGSGDHKHDGIGSALSPHDFQIAISHQDDGSIHDLQNKPTSKSTGGGTGIETEATSLHSSKWGEQETLRCSRESLHPGSQDDLRSNSDGDSSGLEMEYIIVSGTVKEAEREGCSRRKQVHRQSDETGKVTEMFSRVSYAARVQQDQLQAVHRDQENSGSATSRHPMMEVTSYTQPSHSIQPLVEDGNHDGNSSSLSSSLSPSLRYPSDHFLKAREEVYVHSQISMEDSDEGGQSPSAPPTSLGDIQTWKGQLARTETPQTTSEPQSPIISHSSLSRTSSSGTPLSESGVSTDRGLGLPFSGDLMEEENDQAEHEEDINPTPDILGQWSSEGRNGRMEEGHQSGSAQLLHYAEELNEGSLLPERDKFQQNAADYCGGQLVSSVLVQDKWSIKQQISDQEASRDTYPFDLRQRKGGSQFPAQSTNRNAALQWTGSDSETQGHTQYGYNYHHIDQRTENQGASSACLDIKPNYQSNNSDVYAEFTSDASVMQYGPEQAEHYYDSGVPADYSLDEPGSRCNYMSGSQYGDSNSRYTSGLPLSQDQADGQCQYEPNHTQYQFDGHPCRLNVYPERDVHPQYRPEEYVDFLLQRQTQQGEGSAGMKMMMKMVPSEEVAEHMDNSADLPAGSHQSRKWFSPQADVSLEQSEGSVLSEDALDTEDDALDTGDDLDVSADELDTPDEADRHGELEESNLGAGAEPSGAENGDDRMWRSIAMGEQEHRIDMKSIEPYKRVISHGGFYAERNAIIVFSACFLPDSNCDNYSYVMENLFLYVINTLELMVAEDYMIVYLNGATPRRRLPGFSWMKKCYQMIDRRLKKNLKMFIIVHPSWFIRTLLGITRPFIRFQPAFLTFNVPYNH
ncbi:hypothetical protein fugu_003898 [Takifugu bimaculatus]|uniref:CRAL-TRIO domain-containing protein n=1 Tax=Takifugu bimaculatus TaxID=433685 RepID=A0A4Z2BB76_9TELE|nr:hypothetical protein fugu_003898 [Takifugu bimaculatus]